MNFTRKKISIFSQKQSCWNIIETTPLSSLPHEIYQDDIFIVEGHINDLLENGNALLLKIEISLELENVKSDNPFANDEKVYSFETFVSRTAVLGKFMPGFACLRLLDPGYSKSCFSDDQYKCQNSNNKDIISMNDKFNFHWLEKWCPLGLWTQNISLERKMDSFLEIETWDDDLDNSHETILSNGFSDIVKAEALLDSPCEIEENDVDSMMNTKESVIDSLLRQYWAILYFGKVRMNLK